MQEVIQQCCFSFWKALIFQYRQVFTLREALAGLGKQSQRYNQQKRLAISYFYLIGIYCF